LTSSDLQAGTLMMPPIFHTSINLISISDIYPYIYHVWYIFWI